MTLSQLYVLDPLSSAGYCLRCWRVVRNECIPGMSPDSFEWITTKLRIGTYQRLAKTLGIQGTPPLRRCEWCAFPLPDLTRSRLWLLRRDLRVWHVGVGGFGPADEFFCGRGGGGCDRGDNRCRGRGGV